MASSKTASITAVQVSSPYLDVDVHLLLAIIIDDRAVLDDEPVLCALQMDGDLFHWRRHVDLL